MLKFTLRFGKGENAIKKNYVSFLLRVQLIAPTIILKPINHPNVGNVINKSTFSPSYCTPKRTIKGPNQNECSLPANQLCKSIRKSFAPSFGCWIRFKPSNHSISPTAQRAPYLAEFISLMWHFYKIYTTGKPAMTHNTVDTRLRWGRIRSKTWSRPGLTSRPDHQDNIMINCEDATGKKGNNTKQPRETSQKKTEDWRKIQRHSPVITSPAAAAAVEFLFAVATTTPRQPGQGREQRGRAQNTGSYKYFTKINDRLNIRLPPFCVLSCPSSSAALRSGALSWADCRGSQGRVRKRDKIMYQTSNYIKLFSLGASRGQGGGEEQDETPSTMKCDDEEDGSLSLLGGALQSLATVCHVGTNVPWRWTRMRRGSGKRSMYKICQKYSNDIYFR